MKRRRGLK